MKITKDIWILLTEYDELSQIEIIFYKNSTNLVKPYLYYTNKSSASLLKMEENDFVFFSKLNIDKNSEFKFAIIGEQEVIKYEIYLGNNSEDCYLIKEEKCESSIPNENKYTKEKFLLNSEPKQDLNKTFENLIKDFTMPLDINNDLINIKNAETDNNTDESLNIEDTNKLEIEDIFNITNQICSVHTEDNSDNTQDNINIADETFAEVNDTLDIDTIEISTEENINSVTPFKKENRGKHCKETDPSTDENISFQGIIDAIDSFDFSFDKLDTIDTSTDTTDVIVNEIIDDIIDDTTNKVCDEDIEDINDIKTDSEESIFSDNEISTNENSINIDIGTDTSIFSNNIKIEDFLNNNIINLKNDLFNYTNEDIIPEPNENTYTKDIQDNQQIITNNALIVSSDKKIKCTKRHGLSFGYKMNKKIKISLIKLYRMLPNFLKGDYRRRINL